MTVGVQDDAQAASDAVPLTRSPVHLAITGRSSEGVSRAYKEWGFLGDVAGARHGRGDGMAGHAITVLRHATLSWTDARGTESPR